MQTKVLKILLILAFPILCHGQQINPDLAHADSLYKAKQYTQSFSTYQALLKGNKYTFAMLLKMAYIQEGLGHQGLCLYYLNLYQHASDDHQAIAKMEELASKHRLEGYQSSETSDFFHFLQKSNLFIEIGLAATVFFFFSFLFFQKKREKKIYLPTFFILFFSLLLFVVAYFGGRPSMAIVSSPATYLMSGPSAGASVTAIVGEGHRLIVKGEKDVWLHVKWKDKDVFVKQSNMLPIKL
jgi:hypothetical protein